MLFFRASCARSSLRPDDQLDSVLANGLHGVAVDRSLCIAYSLDDVRSEHGQPTPLQTIVPIVQAI